MDYIEMETNTTTTNPETGETVTCQFSRCFPADGGEPYIICSQICGCRKCDEEE